MIQPHHVQAQVQAGGHPAEVSTWPSSTKSTSWFSRTSGNSRRNRFTHHQCVVAGRPSSKPAAASANAPVQIDITRLPAATAARNASPTPSGSTPSVTIGPSCTPQATIVSAHSNASRPCCGSTWYPAVAHTGPPSGVHTRTS